MFYCFDEYPETEIDFEPAFFLPYVDDDYLEAEYFFQHPDNPFTIFQSSQKDIISFSRKFGNSDGYYAMNRMIFMPCFSGFEA